MHGVKRSKDSNLFSESSEEFERIESYQLLVSNFTDLYKSKEKNYNWAEMMLKCSGELIERNPEYYTAFNERKRAIDALHPFEDFKHFLEKELNLSALAIKNNSKSYCAWYHRRWFIEKYCVSDDDGLKGEIVQGELLLLSKFLDYDFRNFHGWNYRIWLAKWAKISVLDEFDFTTLKIYQNFSNYSAWQHRTTLLIKYCEELKMNEREIHYFLRNEVEMCRNASWTEPSDQSVWFYQKWLFIQLPKLLTPNHKSLLNQLARDQIDSITKLIEEEDRGPCVGLAMSFVRNLMIELEQDYPNDERLKNYLERLIEIDPLRAGHWLSFK